LLFEIIDNNRFPHIYPDGKTSSWFLGKTLISGKRNFDPDIFEGSEKEDYQAGIYYRN